MRCRGVSAFLPIILRLVQTQPQHVPAVLSVSARYYMQMSPKGVEQPVRKEREPAKRTIGEGA